MSDTFAFKKKTTEVETSLSYDDILIQPTYSDILPPDVNVTLKLNDKLTLSVPVFSSGMDTITSYEMAKAMSLNGACGPLHPNAPAKENIEHIRKLREELGDSKPICVTISVSSSEDDIRQMVEAGANMIVVDCNHGYSHKLQDWVNTHGHSNIVGDIVKHISSNYPDVFLIAGNVTTAEAAAFLIERGAKGIKVGMGCGSICTTRKVTGLGRGQITSIADVADECRKHGVIVIADGGIKSTDEIVKAIVCGADAVMMGFMFAGCDECPGEIVEMEGEKYKYYRGMGSKGAMKGNDLKNSWVPEGVESYVKAKGPVKDILFNIEWSLKASFGYIGAANLKEAQEKAKLTRTTNSVLSRTSFHSIDKLIKSKKNY